MTRAGDGGYGDSETQSGLASQADTIAPTHLRGGCAGQGGGARTLSDAGIPGQGGHSVYLVSGGPIVLGGAINASGAGGEGGRNRSGGSGGGSGGMIVLHSSAIMVSQTSVLIANGGAGGGGSQGPKAGDGQDPDVASPFTPASSNANGGRGYPADSLDRDGRDGPPQGGGGGGGGGGGAGYIRSNQPLTGALISPPVDIIQSP
jgi:hypothetical protein